VLYAEQGVGDTIQFVRYVPEVAACGGRVVVAVQAALRALVAENFGHCATVITQDNAVPHYDVHCPLMTLPLTFDTTLDSIPSANAYLSADPVVAGRWRERIGTSRGLKVGLAWAGNSQHLDDKNRSIAFEQLLPLLDANVQWFSLQVGERSRDAARDPLKRIADYSNLLTNFAETAGMIASLDLVISVDTAVAHLAGALGKPVWLLLPFMPDWRWLMEREDSPWYPTARLFRQRERGNWREVVERVRAALTDLGTA
jgi:hypothetical protein